MIDGGDQRSVALDDDDQEGNVGKSWVEAMKTMSVDGERRPFNGSSSLINTHAPRGGDYSGGKQCLTDDTITMMAKEAAQQSDGLKFRNLVTFCKRSISFTV
jgi:hypothetical protein